MHLAAEAVIRHAIPESYADLEWPVLARRLGSRVSVLNVGGLEWETPDHLQGHVAGPQRQREIAAAHDQDAERWSRRVQTDLRIIQEGIDAVKRPLEERNKG